MNKLQDSDKCRALFPTWCIVEVWIPCLFYAQSVSHPEQRSDPWAILDHAMSFFFEDLLKDSSVRTWSIVLETNVSELSCPM